LISHPKPWAEGKPRSKFQVVNMIHSMQKKLAFVSFLLSDLLKYAAAPQLAKK